MLTNLIFKATVLALSFSFVQAKRKIEREKVVVPAATRVAAPVVPTIQTTINNIVVKLNTSTSVKLDEPVPGVAVTSVGNTVLILARDAATSYSAYSGLNGYGIPYQVVLVPSTGVTLPQLNSSATVGNYGAIVVLSEVSYQTANNGFQSALTAAQWAQLYQYQVTFAVRMVRLDVYPGPAFGTTALGGCCATGVDQLISLTNTSAFPGSGLKTGAGVSTTGLYHYPAKITDKTLAVEVAQFGPTTGFSDISTAAVINTIGGRQQMVWFATFATDWSASSNFLNHAWITWATRGLYAGYRRINLNTQVDDMFLITDIYSPPNTTYAVTTDDLAQHVSWTPKINAKLPAGSSYFIEIGHNGNGNIESAANTTSGETACTTGPIEYDEQIDTPLEFSKALGTGQNLQSQEMVRKSRERDAFAHVSHTFTHEDQNNATYFDVSREISWNTAWLKQVGLSSANRFSSQGIIPPAITGLHNGDALRAWKDNGIIFVVGDNTRPVLMNKQNEHWPLMTTVAANGYDGIQINPRWASNIYYNCPLPDCTVLEWQKTSAGKGNWTDLLAIEKNTNIRHLLGLHHDPFMFHQANMNYVTAPSTVVNGVSIKGSMLQIWVETMVQELVRLIDWPVISLKHDDMALSFLNRMNRDACNPILSYTTNPTAKTITAVTLTCNSNKCDAKIPVTVPAPVTDIQGFVTEQLGSDPLTIWVQMTGSPVTFTLKSENLEVAQDLGLLHVLSPRFFQSLSILSHKILHLPRPPLDNHLNPGFFTMSPSLTPPVGENAAKDDTIISKPRSCISRRSKLFWIILGAALLAIAIGLGVGLGVGLTRNKNSEDNGGSDDTQFFPPSNNTNATLGTFWKPSAGLTWQIVLQSPLGSTAPNVSVYDIDLFDNNATIVDTLHSLNRSVICYFSAGSYEDFRSDSNQFLKSDYANPLKNWPGEYWLNTNSTNVRKIMTARLDVAKAMGCDGVDPDNIDGYDNDSGFTLTPETAIDYLTFLAIESHERGMAIGLKNAGAIVNATVPFLQWEVNEQCVAYNECDSFRPYLDAGKPIFHIEYPDGAGTTAGIAEAKKTQICGDPTAAGFSTVLKMMDLSDWLEAC
ncbi:hypothetical protein G7Y89_g5585 [Cudoniella acicularis]|uniref:alpha-galactosidase n=1 Tax=Cudoniella acicularis TaxID=354080 RepID=A0A8H4RNS1_9HELO|nr:hypothetical protein G7Y89_g5585 [Cudoniella acicularis]